MNTLRRFAKDKKNFVLETLIFAVVAIVMVFAASKRKGEEDGVYTAARVSLALENWQGETGLTYFELQEGEKVSDVVVPNGWDAMPYQNGILVNITELPAE